MALPFKKIVGIAVVVLVVWYAYTEYYNTVEDGTQINLTIKVLGRQGVITSAPIYGASTQDITEGEYDWNIVLTDENGEAQWRALAGTEYTWKIFANGYETKVIQKSFNKDNQTWKVTLAEVP